MNKIIDALKLAEAEPVVNDIAFLKSFLACEIECELYETKVLPAIERYADFIADAIKARG